MKALIFGITGQDGSYLSELLLEKGYEVHGIIRRSSSFNTGRIDHIYDQLALHYGDLSDAGALRHIIGNILPDEIYNLAAQSHVRVSFDQPEYTADINALGTLRILEAIRDITPEAKFYQASSSEMFGSSPPPQGELTPFKPSSPYGCAKVFSFYQTRNYREAYGLFACNGILFNHESERRGETFVTRKITRAAGRIKYGLQRGLLLGNLDAKRDWGYSPDYVRAMWLMLQQKDPSDYVIATGESHTVREFAELAFDRAELSLRDHLTRDERYFRPTEVDILLCDSGKARRELGWSPKVCFKELINKMVDSDMELAKREAAIGGRI